MTLRQALKAATDDLHQTLDARLERFDLARPDDYKSFLLIHARVLPPIEQALDQGGIATLLADWELHRRSGLIEHDLAALGVTMPPSILVPAIQGPAELLGTAYVIEGSRLGSRFLAKRVGDGMPAEYLNASGQQKAWPTLLSALDQAELAPPERARATEAARACFALFLAAAEEVPANG